MLSDEDIQKYVKISKQSRILVDNLSQYRFNFQKFLKWFIENKIEIGAGHVLEYLKKQGDINDNKNK